MVLWRTLRRRGLQAFRAERSTRISRRTSNRSWSSLYRRFGWFRRTQQAFDTRYRRPSEARTFYFAHPFDDFAHHDKLSQSPAPRTAGDSRGNAAH
jgi:hypothetical protein